jgi:hypothetical protein
MFLARTIRDVPTRSNILPPGSAYALTHTYGPIAPSKSHQSASSINSLTDTVRETASHNGYV